MEKVMCFIDTEFNQGSSSYNLKPVEITQIGAVIFKGNKIVNSFSMFCSIQEKVTENCKKITGITDEILEQEGKPFNDVMKCFADFLKPYGNIKIYAYSQNDAMRLRETAKLNKSSKKCKKMINEIINIEPFFKKTLNLVCTCSLAEICDVCGVEHNQNHSAAGDAADLAMCYSIIVKKSFQKNKINELNAYKLKNKQYGDSRRIKRAAAVNENISPEEIKELFSKIAYERGEVLAAIRDDMMMLIGHPEEVTGVKYHQGGSNAERR